MGYRRLRVVYKRSNDYDPVTIVTVYIRAFFMSLPRIEDDRHRQKVLSELMAQYNDNVHVHGGDGENPCRNTRPSFNETYMHTTNNAARSQQSLMVTMRYFN